MNGEDVGGSRLSVCKLSALGQSCQFSVTLDWHFTFIVQTEFGIKAYRRKQEGTLQATITYTKILDGLHWF